MIRWRSRFEDLLHTSVLIPHVGLSAIDVDQYCHDHHVSQCGLGHERVEACQQRMASSRASACVFYDTISDFVFLEVRVSIYSCTCFLSFLANSLPARSTGLSSSFEII